jgi:hypothetical protein
MAKITVTFEVDSWHEALSAIAGMVTSMPAPEPGYTASMPASAPDPELHAAAAPEPKKATRAKPSATKAAPPEPEPELEPEAPAPRPSANLPPLDVLKQTVTVAVRAAQKNGGPKKILELLPDFKQNTNVDFIMNCKEEHRAALYGLVQEAGLTV